MAILACYQEMRDTDPIASASSTLKSELEPNYSI